MTVILIFSIAAVFSTAGIIGLFAYRLQWLKKIRLSFPENGERFLDSFLRRGFGNEKIEKYALRCWNVSQKIAAQCALFLKERSVSIKIQNRLDRLLGKKTEIPERETTSVFLKSIAEYKNETRGEDTESVEK